MSISVVIPLYNKEKHIFKTLKSVINQSYKQFEIIVVDDGSTDKSLQVVKSVNDPRVKIIEQENAGVSVARNTGIYNASYDYIGFLDADDEWKEDFLEKLIKLIDAFPGAGAYATAYEIVKPNGENIKAANGMSLERNWEGVVEDYFKHSIKKSLLSSSTVVIPKKIFEKVGYFSSDLNRGEDLDMWYRIALNYKIVFCNKVLATYYQDAGNRSTNREIDFSRSFIGRVEQILDYEKKIGIKNISFEEYMISRIYVKANYYISTSQFSEAQKLLGKYKKTKYNKKTFYKLYLKSLLAPILKKR